MSPFYTTGPACSNSRADGYRSRTSGQKASDSSPLPAHHARAAWTLRTPVTSATYMRLHTRTAATWWFARSLGVTQDAAATPPSVEGMRASVHHCTSACHTQALGLPGRRFAHPQRYIIAIEQNHQCHILDHPDPLNTPSTCHLPNLAQAETISEHHTPRHRHQHHHH
ncbi:hypothetical protein BST61_g3228 [Cercospora zeina]